MIWSRRPRSLRLTITLAATAVFAVPLFTAVGVGAVLMRQEAERASANTSAINLCFTTLGLPQIPALRDNTRDTLSDICKSSPEEITTDQLVPLEMRVLDWDNRILYAQASVTTISMVPHLSLWPFTDPNSVRGHLAQTVLGSKDHQNRTISDLLDSHIAFAESQQELNHQLLILLSAALMLIGMVGAAVWYATGRVLRPVEEIRQEVTRISEQDLTRRVSLSTKDSTSMPTESVDLVTLVWEETDRHRPSALTITVTVAAEPVTVTGSRTLLARMLANLLGNAERYANSSITVPPDDDGAKGGHRGNR